MAGTHDGFSVDAGSKRGCKEGLVSCVDGLSRYVSFRLCVSRYANVVRKTPFSKRQLRRNRTVKRSFKF